MFKTRFNYLGMIVATIMIGLISRTVDWIPLYVGDMLYAVMIFFIMRFVFINRDIIIISFLSLIICYSIEFSQLYQAEWISGIRRTLPGRLVLGQGFLWSDLIAYTTGILIVSIFELYKSRP